MVRQIRSPRARRWCLRNLKSLDDSGAAAVEMAVVFPLFLVITLAVLAYGIYFGAAHSVQQLAADAARSSIPGLSTAERMELSQSFVETHAGTYPLIQADKVTVVAAPSADNVNDMVVTVTYDARSLPIWGFSSFFPLPSTQIERVAVIHRGGAR